MGQRAGKRPFFRPSAGGGVGTHRNSCRRKFGDRLSYALYFFDRELVASRGGSQCLDDIDGHGHRAGDPRLDENNVRLSAIGDLERMPSEVRERLDRCMRQTASNTGITLVLALSYSSRWELVRAARFLAAEVAEKHLLPEDINEDSISSVLTTADIPDPDLLIRTGGEYRISNFLLWQAAYAELYFTSQYWPDFDEESLYRAICDYQSRERRFGKISEQL